jgi:undecaprenyl-diphosphatase
MDVIQAIILGLIQGTVEWLPISSEAQTMLYMLNHLGLDPQTALTYAFFLHVGTMLAAVVRFRDEFADIVRNLTPDYRLTRVLVIGTLCTAVSAVPLYLLLKHAFVDADGTIFTLLIGLMLIVTGLLMKRAGSAGSKHLEEMTDRDAILVGVAQGFAIIPGISRSGTTVAALLARNIEQETALTVSFVMSVPAALGVVVLDFGSIAQIPIQTAAVLLLSSLVVGYLSMDILLKVARRVAFWIFCVALGALTVILVAGGALL